MEVEILGDPHMGRKFTNGVPLHRRGERERSQLDTLRNSLATPADLHICVGDLFDKAVVPFSVILDVAELYWQHAAANPDQQFVVIRGNHDASRDLERKSAFDIFQALMADVENVEVLSEPLTMSQKGFIFLPWDPIKSAAEIAEETLEGFGVDDLERFTVVGHWDVDERSQEFNLIPTKVFQKYGITRAITGHDHTARTFTRHGVEVTVTGSMQPYSHAEDPNESIYITRSLADVEADPSAYEGKCLRVLLEPGESLDFEVDCLQLTTKRVVGDDEEDEQVDLGDFNLEGLFRDAMAEAGVGEKLTNTIWEKYRDAA